MVFHGYVGIKHLMLDMNQIMLFRTTGFYFLLTIDCFSVHPRTKHDVGYRLSRSGLAVAYGQKLEFQGPIVSNVSYINGSNTVTFTYIAVTSIELRNSEGFEVTIRCILLS
jgi:hypothetical protein